MSPSRSLRLTSGQTIIFLGDHTSPDRPGYVRVIADVLGRFHPELKLRMISAGRARQTAEGLRSRTLLDLLGSSRPDWVAIGVGLTDALREPTLPEMMSAYRQRLAGIEEDDDPTLGPRHEVSRRFHGPPSDSGPALDQVADTEWRHLPLFIEALSQGLTELAASGVRTLLITPAPAGYDTLYPLNLAFRAYARAMRRLAEDLDVPVVDVEQAVRNMFDRAANYKQRVALADLQGRLNPQGEALVARTFLNAAGLLPYPGFRR